MRRMRRSSVPLLLGLYDHEGKLNHVGHTSGFAGINKIALTRDLEALRGGEGFNGRGARWAEPMVHGTVSGLGAASA